MSEPVAKQRPMIDINEFERRLRPSQAAQRRQNDDPLAELARLVHNDEDPYQNVFQDYPDQDYRGQDYREDIPQDSRAPVRRVEPAMPRMPSATALNTQAPRGFQAERVMPQAPGFQQQAPQNASRAAPAQNLGGNFAAIEAGLRGSFQPDFRQPDFRQPDFHQPDLRGPSAPPPPAHEDEDDHWLDHAQASLPQMSNAMPMPSQSRSNRLLYLTAAVILLGAGGIGATFAIKRTPESPQQIAMIKASTTPAKIQAPKPTDNNNLAMQDASVLDKTPQPSPTGVVNRVEQPVDLSVTGPKPQTPPPATSATSVPVPTPPTEAAPWQAPPSNVSGNPQVADASSSQAYGLDGMIKSRKVKTVAVRPDGSVVAEDPAATGVAMPAAPSPTSAKPTSAKPAAEAPRSSEAARASNGNASDLSPVSAPKPRAEARSKPVKVANVDPAADADTDAGSGADGFSVQLAAAPSAGEAEHVMNKLAQKYSSTLAGHKLKFHRAKVNDKSVFRVRVGGMTKGGAVKLCEALKAKGGSCFIAHD